MGKLSSMVSTPSTRHENMYITKIRCVEILTIIVLRF